MGAIMLKRLLHNPECEFVSLGYNCDVAQLLRYTGLRNKAYPFDWCITPSRSVIALIKNDFSHFLDLNNITFSEPHRALFFNGENGAISESDEIVVTAHCSKYKMSFPHDYSSADMHHAVLEKYNKRIDRIFRVLRGSKTVVFIFNPEVPTEKDVFIDELEDCLSVKYPSLKFFVYSIDELEKEVKKSLKKSTLRFFNKKAGRVNQFIRNIFDQFL